ncbi:MAG TPA: hypothetical protein VNJ01_00315 [Bacteriovoracaceae bacterium]|nr:hypothetical protein [Bacteriovoracaceae bacterium]
MIYNKTGHPVEVKKISIRLWSLRDEIEAALGRRIKECEASGVPLFIEDIKSFYNLKRQGQQDLPDNVLTIGSKSQPDDMSTLMESLGDETKKDENQTLSDAEVIIAEQTMQGLETKKPNPVLNRPYQRQAPDLEKISYGFTLLSDINMEHLLSFTKDSFLQGQSVVVEFLIPKSFMMTADVTYCHHYAMRSRIISSTKPDFRLQCRFSFSMLGERECLRNFLRSIEPTIQTEKKKGKKDPEDDSLGI